MVEMMIILSLIGLMAAISAPPLFRYFQSNRLATGVDRLVADMQYARSRSISTGRILRLTATPAGYTLADPVNGTVIRTNNFDDGVALDANVTVDFFPWGMADGAVMNLANCTGTKRIRLLPTGIVEVQ
jgi:type IV fimbrial biogenesis protein FimT